MRRGRRFTFAGGGGNATSVVRLNKRRGPPSQSPPVVVARNAAAAIALGELTLTSTATGGVIIRTLVAADVTLGELTLGATATAIADPRSAAAGITLGALALVATADGGEPARTADAAITLGALGLSATAIAGRSAVASVTLGALTLAATATGGSVSPSIVDAVVANTGAAALTAPYVQFPQGFADGHLTSAQRLAITDDLGGAVTYTAARRGTAGQLTTNTRMADLFCKLSNNIAGRLTVSTLTRSGATATCATSAAHGLATGNKVLMEGQVPTQFIGLYPVTVTGAMTFTYVMEDTPASNATTTGVMCYTRTLSLASQTGAWNDTLPASKTSANILTDIQANFDNMTLTLGSAAWPLTNSAGATVGSGVWTADFFTCLAQAGTDKLRVTATGPTLCDFTGIMKFKDTVGGARHATLAGWFYVSAFLNPSTGAVVELQGRAFINQGLTNAAMDYFTFQSSLALGTTIVRSLGQSTDTAIDGKVQSFAPSAVTTATGVITLAGHSFQGNERVRLTTSGGLPGGWSNGTDYCVIWVDASHIALTTLFHNTAQLGTATHLAPSTQGTGTHTITCLQQIAWANHMAYVGADGMQDRWTGATGALSPVAYHVCHDRNYLQTARMVPPLDLGIVCAAPAALVPDNGSAINTAKARYVLGSPGIVEYGQDVGGAGAYHEYGSPFSHIPARRARYPHERGYAQSLRVSGLGLGAWGICFLEDATNWRPSVGNNTSYAGMSAPRPAGMWFRNYVYGGYVTPTSFTAQPGLLYFSASHRYTLLQPLYLFEGRQEVHDAMFMTAMQYMIQSNSGDFAYPGQVTVRHFNISGTDRYSVFPGSEPRNDAWSCNEYTLSLMYGADAAPEKPVIKDYLRDSFIVIDYLANTLGAAHDPNWPGLVGGWANLVSTMQRGPGVAWSGDEAISSILMEYYISMAFGCSNWMYPSSESNTIAPFMVKYLENVYGGGITNSWISNSYYQRVKQGAALQPNAEFTITSLTDAIMPDQNIDLLIYRTDGVVWGCKNGNNFGDIYPAVNDRHYVGSDDISGGAHEFFVGPPPQLTLNASYFIRQPSGSYNGWKYATTNSDGTIVGAYSPITTTTSSTTIGTGTTTITLAAGLSGIASRYPLIAISSGAGVELVWVNTASPNGQTSLSISRAQYQTTALNHGAGATVYVPYQSGFYGNYQERAVAFPPTGHCWRAGAGAGLPDDGYLTGPRAAAWHYYLAGKMSRTAFDNADAWFNDAIMVAAGEGPTSFGPSNYIRDAVDTSLTP